MTRNPASAHKRLDAPVRLSIREATEADLESIIGLYRADAISAQREVHTDLAPYREAFKSIAADPGEMLVVGCNKSGTVVATLQLSILPSLSRGGARRAQVENVHVSSGLQGQGAGTALMQWATDEARRRGCVVMQLTSDARRADAHRFYERLGFEPSHVGFKRPL